MEPIVVSLMLLAGVFHASWHAIVKSGNSNATLVGMGLVSSLLLSPIFFLVSIPNPLQFAVIFGSVIFHMSYKIFLQLGYKSSNYSQTYALSRGLTPIWAIPIAFIFLDQLPSAQKVMGIICISIGIICILRNHFDGKSTNVDMRYVLLTSLTVAVYSVIDAYGARIGEGWLSFTIWLILIDSIAYAILSWWKSNDPASLFKATLNTRTLVAGVLGTITFCIFLWALSRGSAPAVIAFRECSVLFSMLIGIYIFKEPLNLQKTLSALGIVSGLMLIATNY
jgi:drug/metabolite transporter (DMT)-like permease